MFSTLYHSNGNGTSAPLLITDDKKIIHDSGDILKFLYDKGNTWLYPNYKETRALEEYIDKEIGIHLRRVCYYQAFQCPEILDSIIMKNISKFQLFILKMLFKPVFTPMMKKSMNIYEKPSEKSMERVCAALEKLSEMLSDGRKNLLETENYSAADITFASLMYIITCPPSMDDIFISEKKIEEQENFRKVREILKKYPAFDYALKVHKDLRGIKKINPNLQ